ncbi:CHAT domain-containing protein [Nocardioides sp. R1-1]|uniref:CHAT domain-containing protein n=1 Tax=Nocardioides sp. R1-1 TaxID=3383502 RepID=UPI0038D19176
MPELLDLAIDRPVEAERRAQDILTAEPDDRSRSIALQALGIVVRDRGLASDAIALLRQARRAAVRSRDADRESDVRATLGATLAMAGQTAAGLRELERALSRSSGATYARAAVRYAGVLTMVGRFDDARPVMERAVAALRQTGDAVWEARAHLWLAHIDLTTGMVDAAERATLAGMRILTDLGETGDLHSATAYLGEIALARGDLATALSRFREAAGDPDSGDAWFDYAECLARGYLAVGMPGEAVRVLDVPTERLTPAQAAEQALRLAVALLDADCPERAVDAADRAVALFEQQDRAWFLRRARIVAARGRWALGATGGMSGEVQQLAQDLHAEHAPDAALALTLAGQVSSGAARRRHWETAASYRHHPNALVRAAAWHARALAREETKDRGGVLRAAAAGLDAIDEHRRLIGSSELRALATAHGRELTAIALRHAAFDARTLLRWSERTRATALAQPPATSDATTIPASLAALRDNGRQLAQARQEGAPTDELERERLRLERAVRAESHTLSATTAAQQQPPQVEEILAATGDTALVELVDVDGSLHVVVAHAGRVRRRVAADTSAVAALLGPAAMLLRRAARGRPADTTSLGRALQEAILGDAVGLLPDAPVVLAPTARLHGLAWPLLPTLQDRPFAVVPSAGQWLRARATTPPDPATTVLVCGPALASGGAEVPVLAERHPEAVLLDGPAATLDAVLSHLDGAGLVHLAAHGRFRADSPLFSALDLADGPLTVHDLERVRRAPYRVVLSACESGVLAPVGAQELLGLAAALFALGTAGLVCSVGEVNDAATADLMVGLHAALASGSDPATALFEVRRGAAGDPVAAGTAAAFLALGV